MKLNHLPLLLALIGSSHACLAQQARIPAALEQESLDLSGTFGAGRLDVAFAAPGARPAVASVTLRLGALTTTLQACVAP
ncbi:hypothetical protein F2P45_07860 [Massilia sp. CCM 8733]|uniref:Uncharacterized protein n=1 Tax=Massilia mucilaginosa TaxID=2609282 RepID=A0ABX0NQ66_9BURK|nr:hypothetical protein [Massilia mucilaginosa]NHZ88934.1 hypothetical protein [Massilia mucilaginosa]